MKLIFISTACFFLSLFCFSQDINVTFTALGEATSIDSVTALNQRTNQSITLPGHETLVLSQSSGIQNISGTMDQIVVYPNPVPGASKLIITVEEAQKVNLRIQKMTGQLIAQRDEVLQAGVNEFEISFSDNGFYVLAISTKKGHFSSKIVSLSSSSQENKIQYKGVYGISKNQRITRGTKSVHTEYSLDFAFGDNMHYTCYSGVMTTIFTDSTEVSINHDVEFAHCTDPDGMNYDIVIIGDQIWMEDNLAFLPEVHPPSEFSYNTPVYYVHSYNGTSVIEAKDIVNYKKYGVLYNWEAAKSACPSGWHLPSDDEFSALSEYLGSNDGFKMKSTSGWNHSGHGDNSSGFNAFPGGIYFNQFRPRFSDLRLSTHYWTSTPRDYLPPWFWMLGTFGDQAYRDCLYQPTAGFSVRCVKDTE